MDLLFATVSEVVDEKKFVIRATSQNIIEDVIAYPIDTFDEPNIGNPVVLYGIESIFGYSYMYKKMRLEDYTRIKLGNSEIDVMSDTIAITTKDGATVVISSDGDITIKSNGALNLKSDSKITVDAPQVKFAGTNVSGGPGPFCSILVCPYTGQPHVGNTVTK